jgi:ferredoxin-type protein NapF
MIGNKRLPRLAVQLFCLVSASALLWPALPWRGAPRFILQLSPFVAVCSSISLRAIEAGAGIGLIFAGVAVFRRRWFCRYLCPTGLLLEGAASIGLQKISWWNGCPPIGHYAALLTIAGAAAGYPLLLWLDPLAIFSSSFTIRIAAGAISVILAGIGLALLILLSLTSGTVWCARLCPLGGTQELLASAGSWLTGRRHGKSPAANTAFPIPMPSFARRAFLVGAAGVGMGFFAKRVGAARGENAPLRPPGAVSEDRFTGLCLRCGNCVRTCPSGIIQPDTGVAGLTGLLAPTIQYGKKYCLEDCRACTQICPSGALQELSREQKPGYVIGEALVDGSLCLLALGRKDCDACERSCPFDAVHTYWDEEKYVAYPVVRPNKCNGCGACEVACPTERIKAIRVWKRVD